MTKDERRRSHNCSAMALATTESHDCVSQSVCLCATRVIQSPCLRASRVGHSTCLRAPRVGHNACPHASRVIQSTCLRASRVGHSPCLRAPRVIQSPCLRTPRVGHSAFPTRRVSSRAPCKPCLRPSIMNAKDLLSGSFVRGGLSPGPCESSEEILRAHSA